MANAREQIEGKNKILRMHAKQGAHVTRILFPPPPLLFGFRNFPLVSKGEKWESGEILMPYVIWIYMCIRGCQTLFQYIGNFLFSERCNLDCGPHGSCESGHCACEQGWHGQNCELKTCDERCLDHGVCHNGTCLCTNGMLIVILKVSFSGT